MTSQADQLRRNIAVHNRVAGKYEALHGEIFNDVEQSRLRDLLARAIALVKPDQKPVKALDFGCGSGNLTEHLLMLGAHVTAADVAESFLRLVRGRNPGESLETFQLNGRDLQEIPDGNFDLVATYSVLHHIPDYLAACAELARVTRPGGVIVIDHEASPGSWIGDVTYAQFRAEALRFDWRKYTSPMNYVHRIKRIFNPRHSNEGDIHVWPDDHIEWGKVDGVMRENGLEVEIVEDYLLNRSLYRSEVYDNYRHRCSDTRATVYRKGA